MAEFRITNCHTHTFTLAHVPKNYPNWFLALFQRLPWAVRKVATLFRIVGQPGIAEKLDRLYQFQTEASHTTQTEIFANMRKQYPKDTRFVVLPMSMAHIGHGPVTEDIRKQHDGLFQLASGRFAGTVIPFATLHPDEPGAVAEFRRAIRTLNFRGLKLYPRLGYPPDHPVLMNEVYPLMADLDLPVMSHCSRGGIRGKHVSVEDADQFTDPAAFIPVMAEFKQLRVCLAHFGGVVDWRAYVNDGIEPGVPEERRKNWQVAIRDMISCGDWPGLWTDISYTLFHFDDNLPFLRLFLQGDDAEFLRSRVLFGSDYYMTRQERLSERAVCFRLRNALGEDLFWQISQTNPAIWLGECPDPRLP